MNPIRLYRKEKNIIFLINSLIMFLFYFPFDKNLYSHEILPNVFIFSFFLISLIIYNNLIGTVEHYINKKFHITFDKSLNKFIFNQYQRISFMLFGFLFSLLLLCENIIINCVFNLLNIVDTINYKYFELLMIFLILQIIIYLIIYFILIYKLKNEGIIDV